MSDTTNNIKQTIDKTAQGAKNMTDKAADTAAKTAQKTGQALKNAGQKIQNTGK